MNKQTISDILSTIFLSFIATLFVSIFTENYDLNDNVVRFFVTFVLLTIWFWIAPVISPKQRITKESDEILHPVTQTENILHTINVQKHYGKEYNQKLLEKCSCGSKLFRIYNEDTEKGTYIQLICAKCNTKATGLEFNWKEQNKQ